MRRRRKWPPSPNPPRATSCPATISNTDVFKQEQERPMRDIMGMMGKVKEMQAKMEKMQEEIAALEVSGSSGGGLVSVTLDGKGNLKGLKIDPSLFKEDDVEILEDLIVAAHKDAKEK